MMALLLLLALVGSGLGLHYHQEAAIKRRQTHCIYDLLQKQTIATFEVFITDSDNEGDLSAFVQIEGPLAPSDINSDSSEIQTDRNNGMGAQLQRNIEAWPRFLLAHRHNFQDIGMIHHAFHVDFTDSGTMDEYIDYSDDEEQKKRLEHKKIEDDIRRRQSGEEVYSESSKIERIEPESFEPYEWTKAIKTSGWYRMCVQANDENIYVEVDIRSSAIDKLGGVDHETGHVYTHEKKEELDESQRILGSKMTAEETEERRLAEELLLQEIASAVKDYDLKATNKLASDMNSKVSQLQTQLGAMMKRSKGHEQQARRNYKRIARSGMIETLLYLMITGFQVFTIHSWLLNKTLLGR